MNEGGARSRSRSVGWCIYCNTHRPQHPWKVQYHCWVPAILAAIAVLFCVWRPSYWFSGSPVFQNGRSAIEHRKIPGSSPVIMEFTPNIYPSKYHKTHRKIDLKMPSKVQPKNIIVIGMCRVCLCMVSNGTILEIFCIYEFRGSGGKYTKRFKGGSFEHAFILIQSTIVYLKAFSI